MKYLYHGTSESVAQKILLGQFIEPRRGRKSNWEHTCASRRDCVYLTDVYSGYFAFSTVKNSTEKAVCFEIDKEALDPSKLIPDEDFLEQATRGKDGKGMARSTDSMEARTSHYATVSHVLSHMAEDSLDFLGTVAYRGKIPISAVSRISYVDMGLHPAMGMMMADPSISFANHRFCVGKYQALTRWLFGDPATAEEILGWNFEIKEDGSLFYQQREAFKKLLEDRRGVTVRKL